MRMAFTVCLTQFLGMGTSIFYLFGWDVVEPITFLVQVFWLSAGSALYIRHRVDFSINGPYDFFKALEYQKLISANNFDVDKGKFLATYIEEIELMIEQLESGADI